MTVHIMKTLRVEALLQILHSKRFEYSIWFKCLLSVNLLKSNDHLVDSDKTHEYSIKNKTFVSLLFWVSDKDSTRFQMVEENSWKNFKVTMLIKPYKCSLCGKCSRDTFKKCVSSVHAWIKSYQCIICR